MAMSESKRVDSYFFLLLVDLLVGGFLNSIVHLRVFIGDKKILSNLGSGEIFGELSVFDRDSSVSVVANSYLDVFVLEVDTLMNTVAKVILFFV
jgi:hypothetical protein